MLANLNLLEFNAEPGDIIQTTHLNVFSDTPVRKEFQILT